MSVDTCSNPAVYWIIIVPGFTGQKNKRAVKEENRFWQRQITKQVNRQINWQSGRLVHSNKHEYLYCMDNDMVLEMKAETMQIALTLCSYHDDQPPELGGKSQERSAGGRGGTRELYVSWFYSFPSVPWNLSQRAGRSSVVQSWLQWKA